MKATGIIRRIDGLGRVVIPKEIRCTQHIRPSDPLEIFTTADGDVVFKKYSPVKELADYAADCCEVLARSLNTTVLVCDRERVAASAGPDGKEYADKRIGMALDNLMERRRAFLWNGKAAEKIFVCENTRRHILAMYPVLANGELSGAVCVLSEQSRAADSETAKAAELTACFLARQLEE